MSLGGLSGLASGVDTSSIVDKLIAIERQQNARLGLRKSAAQARQTGLKDIATKLNALKTAAQDLGSAGTWATKQTVDSADPTKVTATLTGGAGIGGSTIQVDRLASSAQRGYAWVPDATDRTLSVAYPLLLVTSVALIIVTSTAISLAQLAAPDEMRGRVMSIFMVAFRGGMPLGSLTAGTIASVASAPVALMGAGVLLMALSVWFLTQSHGLKEL